MTVRDCTIMEMDRKLQPCLAWHRIGGLGYASTEGEFVPISTNVGESPLLTLADASELY